MSLRVPSWCLPAIVVIAPFLSSPTLALGQARPDPSASQQQSLAGRYAIRSGPEDLLQIDVQIWGQVNRPGQYAVPDRTDLIGLISWAGGPTESAKLRHVLVVRPLADRERVREVDVERFLRCGDPGMIPRLTPGDVVVVPATRSHGIVRWAGLVSVAALVANVAVLATRG